MLPAEVEQSPNNKQATQSTQSRKIGDTDALMPARSLYIAFVALDHAIKVLSNCTLQPLHGSLVPFDHCTVDSIGLEKSEDVRGSVVRILGGGRSRMSGNPDYDGTDSVLPFLVVGDETSCLDGRVANLPSFQKLADLGSDSVPH